jgi:hypothetical protein
MFVWNVCGTFVEHLWNSCGTFVEHLWNICGTFVERLWNIRGTSCGTFVERLWGVCGTFVERLGNVCVMFVERLWNVWKVCSFTVFTLLPGRSPEGVAAGSAHRGSPPTATEQTRRSVARSLNYSSRQFYNVKLIMVKISLVMY